MKRLTSNSNLYQLYQTIKPPKVGDIVEGTVIGSGRSVLYIDLGNIGTGVVLGREFYISRDEIKNLKKGDKVYAKIIDLENEKGYIELSLQSAGKELAWEKLKKQKAENKPLKIKVIGANKGGLLTEVFGITAFIPSSQLAQEHYPRVENAEPNKIVRELQKLIGKELEVYILDLDPAQEKLILSEKLKEKEIIKEVLQNYKVGDVVDGIVTGIADFGCFIAFPAKAEQKIEGLCHISELSWQLVEKPEDVVKVGQKVQAKIIKIDEDRVFLSLKALQPNPWQEITQKYKKDDIVNGRVIKLGYFGALVEIESGIQGLCHISEFGTKEKMEEVLKVGKEYKFIILQIDPIERKITLKLAE